MIPVALSRKRFRLENHGISCPPSSRLLRVTFLNFIVSCISVVCIFITVHPPNCCAAMRESQVDFCVFDSDGQSSPENSTSMTCSLPEGLHGWCPGVNVDGVDRLNVTKLMGSVTDDQGTDSSYNGVSLILSCISFRFDLAVLIIDPRITCDYVDPEVFEPLATSDHVTKNCDGCVFLDGCGVNSVLADEKNGEKNLFANSTHELSVVHAAPGNAGAEPFLSVAYELNGDGDGSPHMEGDEVTERKGADKVEKNRVYKVLLKGESIGKDSVLPSDVVGRYEVRKVDPVPVNLQDLVDPNEEADGILHFVSVNAKPPSDFARHDHGHDWSKAMTSGSNHVQVHLPVMSLHRLFAWVMSFCLLVLAQASFLNML